MDTTSQIWYTTKNMKGGHRLNLALCDDEQVFLNSLSKKIMDWARRAGHTRGIIIHTFSSSEELLEAWQHGMIIDALFFGHSDSGRNERFDRCQGNSSNK